MRAVALDYETRSLIRADVPEPPAPGGSSVLLRIAAVGVCGTDRDLARFRFGNPPAGERLLILGHEAMGEVITVGPDVCHLSAGDLVVPMVRRPCAPACWSCARGRRDLCVSMQYTERGIMGAHGYFCDYVLDVESDLVRVPSGLVDVAVLAEPLSVVEKAVRMALRLHEGEPRTAVVLGAGTVGLLAAFVLRARGLAASIYSREDPGGARARLVHDAGFPYSDRPEFRADIVIEATGAADAVSAGVAMLKPLGVLIVLGAAESESFALRELILGNRVVAGSVNAGPADWTRAVDDLASFDRAVLERMILRRPFDDFRESIAGPPSAWPKTVHLLH